MQSFYLIVILILLLSTSSFSATDAQTGNDSSESSSQNRSDEHDVKAWFDQYDRIRRRAKMTLVDKFQSRHLLSLTINPLAIFSSEAAPLLKRLIDKYTIAIEELDQLPAIPETKELQNGYLQYFKDAKKLFIETLEVQKEDSDRRSEMLKPLIERKKKLEHLDIANKELDADLRGKYHIFPLW